MKRIQEVFHEALLKLGSATWLKCNQRWDLHFDELVVWDYHGHRVSCKGLDML